ncbi:hypothetical protein ACL03H_15850 [Saccharopolyspora sp. MS10]|uniref:hypothetical protein n=1 Tax=Saccharopolyspora sp. MS10 TaxID=3385973 RepID=UPI0039A151D8
MTRFTEFYGRRPAHLLVLLPCAALAAYAGSHLLGDPSLPSVLLWFAGSAVVHDFVLFPLCAVADGALRRLPRRAVPLINHVRMPVLGAGLTFLLFLPGILRLSEDAHLAATSLSQHPYLGRWLWLVLAMFATSAAIYAARVAAHRFARRGVLTER